MIPEILIIIGYFVMLMVPVATVVVFFRLQARPETARLLPELDSYHLPDEGRPVAALSPAELPGEPPRDGSV